MIDVLLWILYFYLACAAALLIVGASATVWAVLYVIRRIVRAQDGRPAHRRR